MTAREHDPEWVNTAARAIAEVQACGNCDGSCGACLEEALAVLDAVADDIARAERERVLAEVEAAIVTRIKVQAGSVYAADALAAVHNMQAAARRKGGAS